MPNPSQTAAGETFGRYRIVQELGRGGQGTVLLAEDQELERQVALKVLNVGRAIDTQSLLRFRREAEAASKLNHPNICAVYDAGDVDGVPYIAMRYVAGVTLAERIDRMREAMNATYATRSSERSTKSSSIAMSKADVATITALFEKVGRALNHAHEEGLIHRDIKPGNIMVTDEDEPVILDFGLARDEIGDDLRLTQSGDLLGTPAYMSPEQVVGKSVVLDRRTDIYSLGASLYEHLTLRRPFVASSRAELYQQILSTDPPSACGINRRISKELQVVLDSALEKDRDLRYQSALAFAEDLRRVLEHKPILAKPLGRMLRLKRWTQRHPVPAIAIVALLIGLVVALLFLDHVSRSLREARVLALVNASDKAAETSQKLGLLLAREAALQEMRPETFAQMHKMLFACREIRSLQLHAADIMKFEFSSDEELILTASRDQTAKLSRVDSGETLVSFRHDEQVFAATFHPTDPNLILTASGEGTAYLWRRDRPNEPIRTFGPGHHRSGIGDAVFSSDGKKILTASWDGTAMVWSTDDSSKPIITLNSQGKNVHRAEFWPGDEDHVLTVHIDGKARLWDTRRPSEPVRVYAHGRSQLNGVAIASDGEHFVTAGMDRKAVVWHRDGTRIGALLGHRGTVDTAAISPQWFVTVCDDQVVRVFERQSLELALELRGHFNPSSFVAFMRDGTLATVGRDGTARFWTIDAPSDTLEREFRGHGDGLTSVAISPDGSRIATGSYRAARIWDIASGRPIGNMDVDGRAILSLAFNADGSRIAVADDNLRVFDLDRETGQPRSRASRDGMSSDVSRWVVFKGEDTVIGTTESRTGAYRWDLGTGEFKHLFGGSKAYSIRNHRVYVSPHDSNMVLVVNGHDAYLGDLEKDEKRTWISSESWIQCAAFSPTDANQIVVGTDDGVARLREKSSGEIVATTGQHSGGVYSVSFHPDGEMFATASGDAKVRVWDLAGKLLTTYVGHKGPVKVVRYTPDGRRIATASNDRTARLWIVDPSALLRAADRRLAGSRFRVEDLEPHRELLGDRFDRLLER